MNHEEFKKLLEQNPEYREAFKERELQFAFGNAVLRARISRGWTQSQLAAEVGTRQANISRIESGIGNPTIKLLQKIFNTMDLSIEALTFKIGQEDTVPCPQPITNTESITNTAVVSLHEIKDPVYEFKPKTLTSELVASTC